MRPETAAVLEEVRAAFPPEPIEAEGAFEPWGNSYPDAEPYGRQLDGRRWEELDAAYLVRRSDALGFLGTRHLAALLPVYLRSVLEDGVWSPATGMLTIILTRPARGRFKGLGKPRFEALVAALTAAQRRAVAATLRTLVDRDEGSSVGEAAAVCLESYWQEW